MTSYQITLRAPTMTAERGRGGAAARPTDERLVVEADDIVYESDSGVLIGVKLVLADGTLVGAFNGSMFVSAIASDALRSQATVPARPVGTGAPTEPREPAASSEVATDVAPPRERAPR